MRPTVLFVKIGDGAKGRVAVEGQHGIERAQRLGAAPDGCRVREMEPRCVGLSHLRGPQHFHAIGVGCRGEPAILFQIKSPVSPVKC